MVPEYNHARLHTLIIMIACKRWQAAESIHCARRLHKAAADGSQWAPHQWQTAVKCLWTLLSEVTIVFLPIEGKKRAGTGEKQDGRQVKGTCWVSHKVVVQELMSRNAAVEQ